MKRWIETEVIDVDTGDSIAFRVSVDTEEDLIDFVIGDLLVYQANYEGNIKGFFEEILGSFEK